MLEPGYLRVTEILYPFSGLEKIDSQVVANAARRGTKVHKVCEAIVLGLGEWQIDDEISGYIESFQKWWDLGHKVVEVEKRFYDKDLMITGQVDMILETPKGLAILDIKTPARPSKTWGLQGSAYAYMARKQGYDINSIKFLRLNKNGGEPVIYDLMDEFETFNHCLQVFNYFYKGRTNGVTDYGDL